MPIPSAGTAGTIMWTRLKYPTSRSVLEPLIEQKLIFSCRGLQAISKEPCMTRAGFKGVSHSQQSLWRKKKLVTLLSLGNSYVYLMREIRGLLREVTLTLALNKDP